MTGSSILVQPCITLMTQIAQSIVPTVLSILVIVVPVGLTCWAIGFGLNKGLMYLQNKASNAAFHEKMNDFQREFDRVDYKNKHGYYD